MFSLLRRLESGMLSLQGLGNSFARLLYCSRKEESGGRTYRLLMLSLKPGDSKRSNP